MSVARCDADVDWSLVKEDLVERLTGVEPDIRRGEVCAYKRAIIRMALDAYDDAMMGDSQVFRPAKR